MARLRGLGQPIADVIGPHPFTGWQAAFDPLLTPGARNYWKSHDFLELSDAAIDLVVDAAGRLPDPQCEIFIASLGGAMTRVPAEATAFPQRQAHFTMNVHTRWDDPRQDAACIGWARELFDRAAPHAAESVYVNFMPEDEPGRIGEAYGAQPRPAARDQGQVRPRQPVPAEPQRRARRGEGPVGSPGDRGRVNGRVRRSGRRTRTSASSGRGGFHPPCALKPPCTVG